MALPLSLKVGNFLSLGKFFFQNVLKDDYPHKKFEIENYKAITKENNIINYKTEFTKVEQNNQTGFKMTDELKYGIQLWGQKYLQTRVKSGGEIKYHFDLGKFVIMKKEFGYFVACKTTTQLDKFWARFGTGYVSPTFSCWNRIEKNFQGDYSVSSSLGKNQGPLYFGISQIFNLNTKKLEKCDLVCNYNKNGLDLTLQHLSIKDAKYYFPLGKILTAIAYQMNNQYSIAAWRLVFGAQSKCSDNLLFKAKTDCYGKTTMSSKFKINSTFQFSVGLQIPLKQLIKNLNLKTLCKLPFGYSFDINL